jgi:hypothetical protein
MLIANQILWKSNVAIDCVVAVNERVFHGGVGVFGEISSFECGADRERVTSRVMRQI